MKRKCDHRGQVHYAGYQPGLPGVVRGCHLYTCCTCGTTLAATTRGLPDVAADYLPAEFRGATRRPAAVAVVREELAVELCSERTRAATFGTLQADAIMEAAHLTYNAARGRAMVDACIARLQERRDELQPRMASAHYKAARYGSRKER